MPTYSHIVVVFEDNQSYINLVGNATAPFVNNTLIAGGASLNNYHAVTRPAEPNYLAAYAGSTFGVLDNGSYSFADPTLDTILVAAGLSFAGYTEAAVAGIPR